MSRRGGKKPLSSKPKLVSPPIETGKMNATGERIFKLITEWERPAFVCAVPCWAAGTPHSSISQTRHLLFTVTVIWAKLTGALCLRGLDPDSSTCLVWMDSLYWFIHSFYLFTSFPKSSYPKFHLSLCFSHFSSTTSTPQLTFLFLSVAYFPTEFWTLNLTVLKKGRVMFQQK